MSFIKGERVCFRDTGLQDEIRGLVYGKFIGMCDCAGCVKNKVRIFAKIFPETIEGFNTYQMTLYDNEGHVLVSVKNLNTVCKLHRDYDRGV